MEVLVAMTFLFALQFKPGYAQVLTLDELLGNALVEALGSPTQAPSAVGPAIDHGVLNAVSNPTGETFPRVGGLNPGNAPINLGTAPQMSLAPLTPMAPPAPLAPQAPLAPPAISTRSFCDSRERTVLFNRCAMTFGTSHMRYFRWMTHQGTCRPEVFNCSRADDLMRCVNSLPVNVISNRCWPDIRNVLTGFMTRYRVPCSFNDVQTQCRTVTRDLLPIDQRVQPGGGLSPTLNNPAHRASGDISPALNNPAHRASGDISPALNNPAPAFPMDNSHVVLPLAMMYNGGGLSGIFGF